MGGNIYFDTYKS